MKDLFKSFACLKKNLCLILFIYKKFLHMVLGEAPSTERNDPSLWEDGKEKLITGAAEGNSMVCALFR